MPTPIVFEDVAPVVPVRDLQAALERYRQLGFEVRAYGHGTGYGYARRGAVSIHLSEWDEHDPKRTGAVVYLYVTDADAVRAEWASCGVEDPTGNGRTCLGAPVGKWNGNYRHGGQTKATIEFWRFIK